MEYRYVLHTENHVKLMQSDMLSDCLMVYYALKTVSSHKNESSFCILTIRDRTRGIDTHVYDLEQRKVIKEPQQ